MAIDIYSVYDSVNFKKKSNSGQKNGRVKWQSQIVTCLEEIIEKFAITVILHKGLH
jgi:hypothetical protein